MTANRNRVLRCRGLLALLSLVSLCGFFLAPAGAQQQTAALGAEPAAPDFQIIRIKHAAADVISEQLNQLLAPTVAKRARIVADARSNSLLVAGTAQDLVLIKKYADTLDVDQPAGPVNEPRFEIIPLRGQTGGSLEEALQMVLRGRGWFAVDRQRNAVVVSGDDKTLRLAEDLTRRLDLTGEDPRAREMRIRVVWLAASLDRREAPAPPQDLKAVVAELSRIGVTELRLVSQSLVNATEGQQFSMDGSTVLDGPCGLSVSGTAQSRSKEGIALRVEINASQKMNDRISQICKLSTSIVTPWEHSVVLGVIPTGKSTSVFIVQVLPK